jgi:hypothetical protein
VKTPPPPLRIVSLALPALGPRQAEAIIDLLEQIQGALWDTYGDAIIEHASDGEPAAADDPNRPSPSDEKTF